MNNIIESYKTVIADILASDIGHIKGAENELALTLDARLEHLESMVTSTN
jgi:hypothetical protein